jgi:RNA polymerase sigma factor (TIGR02999 family)
MADASREPVTSLLAAVRAGRRGATENLWERVYDELHGIARREMARVPPGDTLQATALVHEAYLRAFAGDEVAVSDRGHFFFAAARAMRDIVVEEARRAASLKRGGGRHRLTLAEPIAAARAPDEDLVALDEALRRLEATDRASADVVMLRYFAGLTIEETAVSMGISTATVKRYWSYARAWLRGEILGDDAGTSMSDAE